MSRFGEAAGPVDMRHNAESWARSFSNLNLGAAVLSS
jgi:hypothetical protein